MAHQHPRRGPGPTIRSARRPRGRSLPLCAPVLLIGLLSAAAHAGSITAESIWDRSNAIERAESQLPAGATVSRSECTVVNVRTGNYRYICTVFYADPPAPTAAPATIPSAPSAPAP